MDQLEKVNKLNELKIKYKRSSKYMICLSYEDIGELIKIAEENAQFRKIPNYIIRGERITISERLYSGLVRSLAWKIEYWDRITKAVDYLAERDKRDNFLDQDEIRHVGYLLLGCDQLKFEGEIKWYYYFI